MKMVYIVSTILSHPIHPVCIRAACLLCDVVTDSGNKLTPRPYHFDGYKLFQFVVTRSERLFHFAMSSVHGMHTTAGEIFVFTVCTILQVKCCLDCVYSMCTSAGKMLSCVCLQRAH